MTEGASRFDGRRFRLLSEAQLDRLHKAAVDLLQDPGLRIMTEEARELLLGAGAMLEGEDVVRVPARLVEEALGSAPHTFSLFDRTGVERLRLGQGNVYFGSGVTNLRYLDPLTRESHDFTLKDVEDVARLTDALTNIDFATTPGVVRASAELPQGLVNQHEFMAMVRNTTKPLMVLVADGRALSDVFDMAEVVAGGREEHRLRPFVVPYLNSVSPLQFGPDTLDKLLLAADRGIPAVCQAAPQVGATTPVTVAGTIAVAAAETLCGLVISQLRRPGTPFITGAVPLSMDMRRGNVTGGGPMGLRSMLAMGQLAHRWQLPLVGMRGGSDSKVLDEQAAIELTFHGFGAVLAGVDLVFDTGLIEGALLFSPELTVMADEVIGMVRGGVGDVEVDDEALALPTIRSVGIGGEFLGDKHTLTHFRELWTPALLSWETRFEWEAAGATTMGERTRERTLAILADHEVQELPEDVVAGMLEVIEARRRSFV